MDKNHTGTISLEELTEAIRGNESQPVSPKGAAMSPSRRRAKTSEVLELFDVMDVNHDQEIHYSDFLAAAMVAREQLRDCSLRAAFARLDTNGSGEIDPEKLRHA